MRLILVAACWFLGAVMALFGVPEWPALFLVGALLI
jgi:hypothetical protein